MTDLQVLLALVIIGLTTILSLCIIEHFIHKYARISKADKAKYAEVKKVYNEYAKHIAYVGDETVIAGLSTILPTSIEEAKQEKELASLTREANNLDRREYEREHESVRFKDYYDKFDDVCQEW